MRLSIYVSSPDSYSDVFAIFYKSFFRYWRNCPYDFYLTTNTHEYDNIKCILNRNPGDTWVERTLAALPKIDSKYLLLMCDDIFLTQPINNKEIEDILDYMDNHDIKYCRLKPINTKYKISEEQKLSHVNKNIPYAVNLQICIIKKDFLIELLGDGSKSAWEIESNISSYLSINQDNTFDKIVALNTPIISFIHGIWKGKWIHNSYRYIRKEYPDYTFKRPRLSYGASTKNWLIDKFEGIIPLKARRFLKVILSCFGMRFTTNT